MTIDITPLAAACIITTDGMLVAVAYWAYRRARSAAHTERLRIEREFQARSSEVLQPKRSPMEGA